MINDALAEVKTKGYPVPAKVKFDDAVFGDESEAVAAYVAGRDTLYLRPGVTAAEMAKDAKINGKNFWSTSFPDHAIMHEVGHENHFKSNPVLYRSLQRRQFSDLLKKTISRDVSEYAKDNAQDFVADVFAGLINGKIYSKSIMRLYRIYGGVWK
jgi:hypothetical protein